MSKPVKILSLDGGGTRGLFPATILNCIKEDTGKQPYEIFDVIVGAATGGIISAALACGLDTSEMVDIYLNRAGYLLPENKLRRIWNPLNLFAPKYPNKNLKEVLEEKFGDKKLKDVAAQYGADTAFIQAALDLSPPLEKGKIPEFKVVIYNSVITDHHEESMVDIALRNSAAVINLPLYQNHTEGGNYANDPAMIGLAFALNSKDQPLADNSILPNKKMGLAADINNIKMFSLGCGSTGSSHVPKDKIGKGNWGLIKWVNYLINLVIDTNMVATQYYVNEMLPDGQYLRINPYYKGEEAPAILRDKDLKIDVTDKQQLTAINEYAIKFYNQKKQEIHDFLQL